MTSIVDGFYKDGSIELLKPPPDMPAGRVRVIIIPQNQTPLLPQHLIYGKYAIGRMSTLEDFQEAEWRGDKELG